MPDDALLEAMIARGRDALDAYLTVHFRPEDRPMGSEALAVVTLEDFYAHPDTCLEFVVARRSLYILGRDGRIVALFCRHTAMSP